MNILQEAARGFRAMMADSEAGFEVTSVDVSPMLPAGAADLSISGIRIAADGGTHIILALVWSGTRQRLGAAMRLGRLRPRLDDVQLRPEFLTSLVFLVVQRWWLVTWESARILGKRIQFDLLRLSRRARGFWRAGVGAAVLVVSTIGLAWTFAGAAVGCPRACRLRRRGGNECTTAEHLRSRGSSGDLAGSHDLGNPPY